MPDKLLALMAKVRRNKWILPILILFVVFAVPALIWLSSDSPQVRTAFSFVRAIQSGDTSVAYRLTSDSFRQYTTESELSSTIEERWSQLPKTKPKFSEKTVDVEGQTVVQVIAYWMQPDGSSIQFVILMEDSENSLWKISGASSYFLEPG